MAITQAETQVTWPTAANSISVTAGSSQTSEEFNLDATCFKARIELKADNSTTAASDDIIDFWLLETLGDPDGASTDEFVTTGHAHFLGRLDTSVEDPAIKAVDLPVPNKGGKIYADGSVSGSTNAITVSATIREQRG